MLAQGWGDAWNKWFCTWRRSSKVCCSWGLWSSRAPTGQLLRLEKCTRVPAPCLCWMELEQRSSLGPPLCLGTGISLQAAFRYMFRSDLCHTGRLDAFFCSQISFNIFRRMVYLHLHVSTLQWRSCGTTEDIRICLLKSFWHAKS